MTFKVILKMKEKKKIKACLLLQCKCTIHSAPTAKKEEWHHYVTVNSVKNGPAIHTLTIIIISGTIHAMDRVKQHCYRHP